MTIKLGGYSPESWRRSVSDGFSRRSPESPLTWLPANIRFPEGWETTRFAFADAPHVRGVIERFVLDPAKRKCILVWGTRLAKTSTVTALLAWKAHQDPVPMAAMFPDNEQLDQIDDHTYPMFESSPLAGQLPPPHVRNKKVIRLRRCRIRLASGGKKSSVSGYPAQWIAKFEHDKTNLRKSSEADPSLRLDSRAGGFWRGVKIFEESTPAKKSESRAWRAMSSPDVQQVHYHVQCPYCRKFQRLHHDSIQWEKNSAGRSEPQLAADTAWYRCESGCRIENHDRKRLMQSGKWLIEGESINVSGTVSGTPSVKSDTMVFGPLSRLHSLLVPTWGEIAKQMVTARHAYALGNEQQMEALYSECFAIPWDPVRRTVRTNELSERLKCDDHRERGVVPSWASFLTFTADVGQINGLFVFYWMIVAWGRGCRGGIVDWGAYDGQPELFEEWKAFELDSEVGPKLKLWGQPSAIDSGTFTEEICRMVSGVKNCLPLKGSSKHTSVEMYEPGFQRVGRTDREIRSKRKRGAPDLLIVNTEITQQWRVALTEGRIKPGDFGFVSLPADVCECWEEYEDFLNELTADQKIDGKWEGSNNEYGDTLRYARALAQCFTKNGRRWDALPAMVRKQTEAAALMERAPSEGARKRKTERFVKGFDR